MRTPPHTIIHLLDGVQLFVRERARRETITISIMPIAIVEGSTLRIYHGMTMFWPRCSKSCRCSRCSMQDLIPEASQATHVAYGLWRSDKPIVPAIRSSSVLRIDDPLGLDDSDQSLASATQKLVKAHLEYTHTLMLRTANGSVEDPRYSDQNVLVADTHDHDVLAKGPTYRELLTPTVGVTHIHLVG